MARLYSKENFLLPAVEKLRALGHAVLTIQETAKADQVSSDLPPPLWRAVIGAQAALAQPSV